MNANNSPRFDIHYYKVESLTPDERNAQRRNQRGIWLHTGIVTDDRVTGLRQARREFRGDKFRCVRRVS